MSSNDRGSPLPEPGPGHRGDPTASQLRTFLALAEELHFGNAARRMFLSQSALSQQIKELERRLGLQLVERSRHSVELTPAGQALHPAIKHASDSVDDLHRLADRHKREISGQIVLGVIGAEASQPHTVNMLAKLRHLHPGLTVEFRSLDYVNQFRAVTRGDVDAAILMRPVPSEFQTLDLATGPTVAVIPASDPLAEAGTPITLAQLSDRTFIDFPPGTDPECRAGWCVDPRPDGSRVRYGPTANDIEAVVMTVAQGDGMFFLPAIARDLFPRPGISYVDVVDLPDWVSVLAWTPQSRSHPVVAALRDAALRSLPRQDDRERVSDLREFRYPGARTRWRYGRCRPSGTQWPPLPSRRRQAGRPSA